MSRLLLLSNSTNYGQPYLEHAKPLIRSFLGPDVRKVAFVPFAGVSVEWDTYTAAVRTHFEELGYELISVHETDTPLSLVRDADAVVVGGGNTFRLVEQLHETGLMKSIREAVLSGTPYVGWSAGSNVACPTMKTTNDMPIVEPPSMNTLNLVPFQINPHYTEAVLPNHQGETRADRLKEFLVVNPDVPVLGLPEGTALEVQHDQLFLIGKMPAVVFRHGHPAEKMGMESDLTFLLSAG